MGRHTVHVSLWNIHLIQRCGTVIIVNIYFKKTSFNPIQNRGKKTLLPYPPPPKKKKNFLTFNFNPFATLWFSWSSPYKTETMITSLIEMPELLNLVAWPHLQNNLSHVKKIYWWHHGQKLWRHKLCFKRPLFFIYLF